MNIGRLLRIRRATDNERGVAMMEYALLASGIAVVAMSAVSMLGDEGKTTFVEAGEAIAATTIIPVTPPSFP